MSGGHHVFRVLLIGWIAGMACSSKLVERAGLRSPSVAAAGAEEKDGARQITSDIDVKGLKQKLLICNAYAYPKALSVTNLRSQERLTDSRPLAYKSCEEFHVPLEEGDRLEFKVDDMVVGIFRATGMPKSKAQLLLIPHRKDANTMTVTFESHAFGNSGQIAVVDTYRGNEVGKVKIMDDDTQGNLEDRRKRRTEELHYNSVVSLTSGKYQIALQNGASQDIITRPLEMQKDQGNVVVMRMGLQASNSHNSTVGMGVSFPQELVVFGTGDRSHAPVAQLHITVAAVVLAGLAAVL